MSLKLYKCRQDIITGVVENYTYPGDLFWAEISLSPSGKKSRYEGYQEFIGKNSDKSFLVPTRALAYFQLNNKSYARLIRHDKTLLMPPRPSQGNLILFDLNDRIPKEAISKHLEMPQETWLQIGYLGDKLIIQIKMIKVPLSDTNCDDKTGELYFYSPTRVAVLLKID